MSRAPGAAAPFAGDPVGTALAAARKRSQRRTTVGVLVSLVLLGAAGATAFFAYRQYQSGQETATDGQLGEDYPSVGGGPRADDQMSEIDVAIDDAHGGEYERNLGERPGADDVDLLGRTHFTTIRSHVGASPDSGATVWEVQYDELHDTTVADLRLPTHPERTIVAGDWVYRWLDGFASERWRRSEASRADGPDLPLLLGIDLGVLLPAEAEPYTTRSTSPAADGTIVTVATLDTAAFEAGAPEAAADWRRLFAPALSPAGWIDPSDPPATSGYSTYQLAAGEFAGTGVGDRLAGVVLPTEGTFVALAGDGHSTTALLVSYDWNLRVRYDYGGVVEHGIAVDAPDEIWD